MINDNNIFYPEIFIYINKIPISVEKGKHKKTRGFATSKEEAHLDKG